MSKQAEECKHKPFTILRIFICTHCDQWNWTVKTLLSNLPSFISLYQQNTSVFIIKYTQTGLITFHYKGGNSIRKCCTGRKANPGIETLQITSLYAGKTSQLTSVLIKHPYPAKTFLSFFWCVSKLLPRSYQHFSIFSRDMTQAQEVTRVMLVPKEKERF